ncbi:MAG: hypothetical protein KKE11_00360 [Gammaproteobacteria bacterium]|nr:hypothetical protein [Gammaproteobacteria bacterium]
MIKNIGVTLLPVDLNTIIGGNCRCECYDPNINDWQQVGTARDLNECNHLCKTDPRRPWYYSWVPQCSWPIHQATNHVPLYHQLYRSEE